MTDPKAVPQLSNRDYRWLRLSFNGEVPIKGSYASIALSNIGGGNVVVPSAAYPLASTLSITKHFQVAMESMTYTYHDANRCIYCSPDDVRGDAFSEEHILSAMLGGPMVLPDASCKHHARITSGIESKLMQNLFDPTRKQIGIKHRNKRPIMKGNFWLSQIVGGKDIRLRLPALEHPTILFLLELGPAGILTERPQWLDGIVGFWFVNLNATPENLAKRGIKAFGTPGLDTVMFSQFLSKIAHSFAAAEVLLENFEPLLVEFIEADTRGKQNDDRRHHFVGGEPSCPPTPFLHELGLGMHETANGCFLIARIRLFAFLGAPIYHVVVGKISEGRKAAVMARLLTNNSRMHAR